MLATHTDRLLDGRVALVTAASRGIGAAIARALGEHGAAVGVNYLHSADRAAEVVAAIETAGGRAVAVRGDVSDADAAAQVVRATADQLGAPDVLVCNALGPTEVQRRPVLDSADMVEAVQRRTTTQLAATMNCCYQVLPGMRARGGGSIVLIGASGSRAAGAPGLGDIAVAKAAQDALGRVLATELGPEGIRVNTVAPGMVATDANAGEHQAAMLAMVGKTTPLRRVSEPADIANVVALLASDQFRQVTGGYVAVDGGRSIG